MTDHEHERREPSDVPGFGRVGGIDDPVPRAEYGDDPEAVAGAGAGEAPPFPDFAAERAELGRFMVERESRPSHDGERIRIRNVVGVPSTLILLVMIRAANADGWLLDKHSDRGDELVFVPSEAREAVEDGESR